MCTFIKNKQMNKKWLAFTDYYIINRYKSTLCVKLYTAKRRRHILNSNSKSYEYSNNWKSYEKVPTIFGIKFFLRILMFHDYQIIFFLKWPNLHERSRISWIEKKIRFFRLLFFELWLFFVIFVIKNVNFRSIFQDTSKNKNSKNSKFGFSSYSADCRSFI